MLENEETDRMEGENPTLYGSTFVDSVKGPIL